MTKKTAKISTLGSQITSVISVALVLLILGVLASIGVAAGRVTNTLLGDVSVIVKMDQNASDADIASMSDLLKNARYAESIQYTSADEVLKQEMEYNSEILDMLDENPYSAEFEVKLKPAYVQPDSITQIGNSLMLQGTVDEVVSQADVVRSVDKATRRVSLILSVVAWILLIISLVLIFNTVSISVYGRRFVIRTMQLVGATNSFVRRPFVAAGVLSGVIAGVLASAMLFVVRAYATSIGEDVINALPIELTAIICLCMIVLGVIICGIASYIATNRYLRATSDVLYS